MKLRFVIEDVFEDVVEDAVEDVVEDVLDNIEYLMRGMCGVYVQDEPLFRHLQYNFLLDNVAT